MRIHKIIYSALVFLSVIVFGGVGAPAEDAVISVDPGRGQGLINKKVFGNNFIGYDPATYENWTKEYYGYSDYGAGIWDPRAKRSVPEVVDLAKKAGMSVARFPGGCGTHRYDWKKAIGEEREHFLYGLDEFLKTSEEIGAESVVTLSYFTGDENDAAELVEYLNALSGQGCPWAEVRAGNGQSRPYHVTYFEVGNEIWHGDHNKIKKVSPQDYAHRYLKYYAKMKAVDPSIKIGVLLSSDAWNRKVLGIVKGLVDFGIVHIYPHPDLKEEEIVKMAPKDIYRETLGNALHKEEAALKETIKRIKEVTGKNIPLAITEYNGGFWQDKPLPYRHCLGTALLNAELLRIFMKPEHNVLMANYWQFVNSHWGMIGNGFNGDHAGLSRSYFKRPNFYVFQLYQEHFGDILVDVKVNCGFYNSGSHRTPYLTVNASKSKDEKKLYLMVVNKNMDDSVSASIQLSDFKAARAQAWVLNGPRVESLNEKDHEEVAVRQISLDLKKCIFEPHSLTAIEITRE